VEPEDSAPCSQGTVLAIPTASLMQTAPSSPISPKIPFNILVPNPRTPKWSLDGGEWIWSSGRIILVALPH